MSLIITVGLALVLFPFTILAIVGFVFFTGGKHGFIGTLACFIIGPAIFLTCGPVVLYLVFTASFVSYLMRAHKD